jgi:hypothetical protein
MNQMMNTKIRSWWTTFCLFSTLAVATAQTPAFPGAEGHGRYATGGRGGTVYYVNSLEDTETGSVLNREGTLRWCIKRSGKRTVLFKVSGTIFLNSALKITNGDLTIAGQSAPGDGICIAGYPVEVNADNVIVRYLRFRMGNERDINEDGADALGGRYHRNIIIDHCSVSWSTDECCSFYQNTNFTLQWCLISESLNFGGHTKGEHGYGGIWGGFGASFHHNLMAHHKSRVPRLGPGENSTPTNELCDLRNNVYYNYNGDGCYGAEAMHANIVNNYYKPGPANTMNSAKRGRIIAIDKKIDNSYPAINDVWGSFYIDGNVVDGHANATNNNWTYGVYNQIHSKYGTISQATKDSLRLPEPLATGVVTTHTAEDAYRQVLLYAGCSLHRDPIDARIVEEVRTNTATYRGAKANRPGIIDSETDLKPAGAGAGWSPWCALAAGTPPEDSDRDGIPDGWLDDNYPGKTATMLDEAGYTCLEIYLNSLVAEITGNQNNNRITSALPASADVERPGIRCHTDSSTGILTVWSDRPIDRIDLFSLSGVNVHSSRSGRQEEAINISALPSGIYLLKTKSESNNVHPIHTMKIIKQQTNYKH